MAVSATSYEHIALDDHGVPIIVDANTKVVELINEMHAYGWSPTEMHLQHPHLSLGQIHSALAYYYDHKDDIDADRERRFSQVEQMRRAAGPSPIAEKLRQKGLLG